MRKKWNRVFAFVLSFLTAMSLFAAPVFADGEKDGDTEKAERTILLYDCGADLETGGAMATYNLEQILRANFSKDDKIKFIVMTGGSVEWHLGSEHLYDPATGQNMETIPTEYNHIWEAKGADATENPGQLVLLDGDGILGDGDDAKPAKAESVFNEEKYIFELVGSPEDYEWMTDPKVLKAFINYGVENYPAEKYDLILWDHGGGPTGGFAVDENSETSQTMSMLGIMDALKDNDLVRNGDGDKFDFVDFDACLMSSVEYVYSLADFMDYYIASPETEPGYGQDYEGWLNLLGENPETDTFTLGKKIVDDFIAFYDKEEGDGSSQEGTLAIYDMEKLLNNPYEEKTLLDDLITLNGILHNELVNGDYYDEVRSISRSMHYGDLNFVDLGQLLSQLGYTFWEADENNLTGDNDFDSRNAYTEVADHIQLILGDQEVIYSRGTKGIKTDPWFYRDNGLKYNSQGTSGIYLFMPNVDDAFESDDYINIMEQYIGLLPEDDQRAEFFRGYLDIVSRLLLINTTANEVADLIDAGTSKADVNYDLIKKTKQEEKYGNEPSAWEEYFLPYIDRLGGEEQTRPWIEKIIDKQVQSAVTLSDVSVESAETQNGSGYKVTINDLEKRALSSVQYRVTAKLPAVDEFLARPGNEGISGLYNWIPEYLTLGRVKGTQEAPFEDNEYKKAVEWLSDNTSVWDLDAYDGKWYALRDGEGQLHVVSPNSVDEEAAIIPTVYETTEFQWDEEEETYEAFPRLNLVLLLFEDGCTKLTEIGFVTGDGLRVIDASQFRGSLELTTAMYYYFWGMIRIELPISKTSFTLSPETIKNNSLSVELTDITNMSDIAGTDISAVVSDIYGGYLDITDLLLAADPASIKDAEVSGITNKTYTGKKITQKPVVKLGDTVLTEGQDYEVSYENNTNAGTAKVTITGTGKYKDSVIKTFKINPAKNKFAIKSAKRKVKAGKTTAGVKVTKKGTGTKTYKIKSVSKKKYAKYFKINKKTGKITVNKKVPKGKYVVTVQAQAGKTKNYKASSLKKAKVTITVR